MDYCGVLAEVDLKDCGWCVRVGVLVGAHYSEVEDYCRLHSFEPMTGTKLYYKCTGMDLGN